MTGLNIGQSLGRVIQMAFVVADIEQAMAEFATRLKIGPWFFIEHLPAIDQVYRGTPIALDLAVALGYAGQMMIELIQQHDDAPSVYREAVEQQGYGFHHYGIATRSFEADVAAHRQRGYELIFTARSPRGNRGAYMEAPAVLGGLIEYIEVTQASEEFYGRMYEAALHWKGGEPVRRLG